MSKSKTSLFLFLSVLCCTSLFAQSNQYMSADSSLHLWGAVETADLIAAPFEWLSAESAAPLDKLPDWASRLDDVEVDIYLGTWCGDSKKWVPAFVELWEQLGHSADGLNFIGLHREGDNYKQGPDGETLGLNIHRVPTFIFRRNSKEVGRIVERPLNDLEIDVQQIALGVASAPRYRAVHRMHQLLLEQPVDSIYANRRSYLREMRREAISASELNTYGIVLHTQGRNDAALLVFRMNAEIFRYNPRCHDSLGELYVILEEWENAKDCFEEVLRLKGEDERASEMLAMIAESMK